MDQLMHVLLIVMLLNMVHHKVSYLQSTPQTSTVSIFVAQCNDFLMFMLNAMVFVINILIKTPLLTSFLKVVTIIFDRIGSNIIKTNEIQYVVNKNSKTAINGRETFQNTENNFNYNYNYNTTIDSMIVGIEGNGAISYDLQQTDLIVILLYVLEFYIIHNGVDKRNESEFKFENENENVHCDEFFDAIIVFNTGFNYSVLSPRAPSSTHPSQHARVFDFDGTEVESPARNVLKCDFNVDKNGNSIYDYSQIRHYMTKEFELVFWQK